MNNFGIFFRKCRVPFQRVYIQALYDITWHGGVQAPGYEHIRCKSEHMRAAFLEIRGPLAVSILREDYDMSDVYMREA